MTTQSHLIPTTDIPASSGSFFFESPHFAAGKTAEVKWRYKLEAYPTS